MDTSGKVGAECSYLRIGLYNRQPSNAKRRRARAPRAGGATWQKLLKTASKISRNSYCLDYYGCAMIELWLFLISETSTRTWML